jgi:hypothetical protein
MEINVASISQDMISYQLLATVHKCKGFETHKSIFEVVSVAESPYFLAP